MTSTNTSTGVTVGPRRYTVGKTGSWTLTVFQDGVMECSCPDAQIRKHQCYHQRDYLAGKITAKPRVRVTARPTVRRVTVTEAMRERMDSLDV